MIRFDETKWYRSSLLFSYGPMTNFLVLTCLLVVILLVVRSGPAIDRNAELVIGGAAAVCLVLGVFFGMCASVVCVRGDDVVVRQLWGTSYFKWKDIVRVSRWRVAVARPISPYVYTLKVAGRKRCILFAHPDYFFWDTAEEFNGWVDFDYFAETPREEWDGYR